VDLRERKKQEDDITGVRMRLAEHVANMNMRNAYKILDG
jgi:hypothetical protein